NVRSATVLGIVGAGGIGMALSEALRSFDYSAASAMLLIILATVSLFDIFSQLLRKVVIDGEAQKSLVGFLAFMFSMFLLAELALANVIDLNAILKSF